MLKYRGIQISSILNDALVRYIGEGRVKSPFEFIPLYNETPSAV